MYKRIKNKSKKWLVYLTYFYLACIIFQSGSVQASVMGRGMLFEITRIGLLVSPLILVVYIGLSKRTIYFVLVAIAIGGSLLAINAFNYPDGLLQLLYKLTVFIEAGCVFRSLTKVNIDINECAYRLLFWMATLTLIMYVMVEILKLPLPYTLLQDGFSYIYRNYFEIFQTYHYNSSGIPRLSGIFWEPGVHQIYLNYGVFLFFLLKKHSRFEFAIFGISIIFTQSSSGYIVFALLVAFSMTQSKYLKKSKKIIGILEVILAVVVAIIIVLRKRELTNFTGESYSLRMLDIVNGFKIFLRHPLFGVGFGNQDPFYQLDTFGRGSSNGLISILYMMGLLGTAVLLFPYIGNITKSRGDNKIKAILWFVLILIFNMSEPIYNLPLMAFWLSQEYYKNMLGR